jgi:hypothetical protein
MGPRRFLLSSAFRVRREGCYPDHEVHEDRQGGTRSGAPSREAVPAAGRNGAARRARRAAEGLACLP